MWVCYCRCKGWNDQQRERRRLQVSVSTRRHVQHDVCYRRSTSRWRGWRTKSPESSAAISVTTVHLQMLSARHLWGHRFMLRRAVNAHSQTKSTLEVIKGAQYTSTFYRLCFCLHSCNWNLSQCARHFCKLILLFLYRGLDIKYIVTIKTISAVPVYANKLNVSCRLYVYNTWNSTDTKRMKLSRLQLHHLCICRLVHGSASKQMYFTPLPCHVSDYCLPSCSSRWIHFLGII